MTRYPALVLALAWSTALAAAVVLAPSQPILGVVAITAAVPIAAFSLLLRRAIVALAVSIALLGVGRAELPPVDPLTQTRANSMVGATAVITGRVADDSRPTGGGAEVLIEPDQIQDSSGAVTGIGNLMVRWRGPGAASFGDRILASGRLMLPRDLPAFDRRAYLAQRGVYLELQASSFQVTASDSGFAGLPGWLRARYTSAVNNAVPAPHASVLLGIVLGIRQGIPGDMQRALIATGLIHLLVLSGLKVAVFARIVQGALSPLLHRNATWPAVGMIALYAMVGGASPAAVRASAMGGLAIVATHLGRPSHVWTSLALTAAAMLGWHPELAWDVGFQLSFAGTAAIILLTPAIARRVAFLPHIVREPFAVTCAAQVGTLPMMATDFHVISPVAPIANALTLPILPVTVAAGLLLAALAFVPEVGRAFAIPITGLIAYIEQVAYLLARAPAAAVTIPSMPTWLGVAYYSALGPAIAGARTKGNGRRLGFILAGVAPACISIAALLMWAHSPPEAVVLSVGDGQALLLRGPHGAILVDGGPSPSRLNDGLGTQLPPWQRTLEAMIITAPGLGHTGGLAGFDRAASTVIVPDAGLTGSAWRTAALEQVARGASVRAVQAGATLSIAGFTIEVLAPERGAPGDISGAADLAFRAVAPDGRSFCDFSDLDLDAQTVASARLARPCTYLLLPTGGRSALSPDLMRVAITPATQLIASRGAGRLAAGLPPNVLRTDQEGAITLPL
ncbi:MAG TPA: ComEC/Rec2 family competence protein [Candidatus Limnocylindrales bacterium]|nr:ComEC/Rec2 family competence protein [Candidatus Limnocylindrales bacterium]